MGRQVMIKEESVYGTPVTPDMALEVESETLRKEIQAEDITVVRTWAVRKRPKLNEKVVGDLTMVGNYQDQGLLLKHLLTSVDTTGAGPYTHTYPASGGIASAGRVGLSLTAEVERDDQLVWTYAGLKVVGLSIEADVSRAARFVWSLMGKSEATGTASTTPSFPDFDIMPTTDISATIDAASQDATGIRLNIGWPVDEPYVLGSAQFGKEPKTNGPLVVEGEINVLVEDLVEYAKYDGSTNVDVAISITDGTHSLTLNMNVARLSTFPVNMTGRERLVAPIGFTSIFDTAATENIQAILVNDDAVIP